MAYTRSEDAQEQIPDMKIKALLLCLCFGFLLTLLCAQPVDADQPSVKVTRIQGNIPAKNGYIVKFYVDKSSPNSGYETGDLHIVYSDKTEIVERPKPKERGTEKEIVYNQEGIGDVKVASDKRTIGWTETFDNCCTSYSIPIVLAIYLSGDSILEIEQGQMLWYWTFRDGGKHIAAVWGPTHGTEVGDYQLYDTRTGRMVSEVFANPASQSLSADAPVWARETERAYKSR
jgi:hypothetical protein